MFNTATAVTQYATQIRDALTNLGLAYTTHKGEVVQINYKRLALAGEQYAILEVDTRRLPPRISIPDLETPRVLSHLSAVVGKPVKKLNTIGLTYVVLLQPPKPKPWPTQVGLPEPPDNLTYPWPMGMTREGNAVWGDLLTTGHLLAGGKPGAGKSTWINAGLVALLKKHDPDTLQLALVDPKTVELYPYSTLPHLIAPVATEAEAAKRVVTQLIAEMERREALFKEAGAKKFSDYNRATAAPLPLLLAVFDEVTDLVIQWGGPKAAPFLELIRLSSKARAFGIVLCFATQNPKADILDTAVRENCGTRIAFKVDTATQSRSILGRSGAEGLPLGKPGRLVAQLAGRTLQTLQGFAVSEDAIAAVIRQQQTARAHPLTEAERDLVNYAQTYLGGAFKIGPLAEAFKGVVSKRQLEKLAQRWELRGWLTKPVSVVAPRWVTKELAHLVVG